MIRADTRLLGLRGERSVAARFPRERVVLPYGWLDSPCLGDEDIADAESDVSGG